MAGADFVAPVNAIAADPSGRPQSEGPCRQGSSVAVAVPDALILDLHVSRLIYRGWAERRSEAQVCAGGHLLHGRRMMTDCVLGSRNGGGSGGEDERD